MVDKLPVVRGAWQLLSRFLTFFYSYGVTTVTGNDQDVRLIPKLSSE